MSQEPPPPTQPVGPPSPPERQPAPQAPPAAPWAGPPSGQQSGQQPYGQWSQPPQPGWQQQPGPGAHPGPYAGPPGPQQGPQPGYPPGPPQAPPTPRDQTAIWRTVLQIACPVVLVIALVIEENGRRGYADWTLWALFATVAAIVQLAPLVLKGDPHRSWTICAVGVSALLGYWVVIVLPGIDTNAGFLQTLAVAAAGVGCWLAPGRRI